MGVSMRQIEQEVKRQAVVRSLHNLLNRAVAYERYQAYAKQIAAGVTPEMKQEGIPYKATERVVYAQKEDHILWGVVDSSKVTSFAPVGKLPMDRAEHDQFHASLGSWPEFDD